MIHFTEAQTQFFSTFRRRPRFPLHISQRRFLLISADLVLLNTALLFGLLLIPGTLWSDTIIFPNPLWFATLTFLWLAIASATDNYDIKRAARASSGTLTAIKTLLITGVIYAVLPLVSPSLITAWKLFLLVLLLAAGLLVLWRAFYTAVLVQPSFQRRALVVGTGRAGRTIAEVVEEHEPGYEILGFVSDDGLKESADFNGDSTFVEWADLAAFVRDNKVSDIILAIRRDMRAVQVQAVLKCFEQGVRIQMMPDLFEEITGRIPVEHISEGWLVSLPIDWDSRRLYLLVKRAMDLIISGFGLLTLAPLLTLVAIAIKLDSPGPVFYRPDRLGRGGKPIRLWKFRTMVANADSIGDPTFTARNDQRITRVGRFLRTIHVDELPQFINVLSGEMSVVGPRPERHVPDLEESIPYYRTRLAVKPGATGWALVKQGYAEGLEETLIKLQYDLYYIKHQSLRFDILILWKTVMHMLTARGR